MPSIRGRAASPLLIHPLTPGSKPAKAGTLLRVSPQQVIAQYITGTTGEVIVSLHNFSSDACTASLQLPESRIASAELCDTLGQVIASLPVESDSVRDIGIAGRAFARVRIRHQYVATEE